MKRMVCVDKQIIPFKDSSSLKQYMPNKPHKYGYKVFVLCNSKDIIHNFELYTGKISPSKNCAHLEASSNIVVKLAEAILSDKNFLMYYDYWFMSLILLCHLAKHSIICVGTIRANQLPGCNLLPDKDLKKIGHGAYNKKAYVSDNTTVRTIKWLDSKSVTLLTTFDSATPVTTIKRFDQKFKKKIDVACPRAIDTYNKFMGRVDWLNSLTSLYRCKLKSKKYNHKIFYHFLDMNIFNS